MSTQARYRRAIEALFVGEPLPRLPGPLGEHLKRCAECRALYASLARADRLLGEHLGAPVELSPFEAAAAWEKIGAGLGVPKASPRRLPWRTWLPVGAALVLLLAGGVLLAIRFLLGGPADGFATRGAGAPPVIALHCIEPGESPAIRPAGPSAEVVHCRLQDTLGFSYLNPGGAAEGLMLFAVGEDGGVLPYLPNPAEPGPTSLGAAETWTALERSVRLAVNHHPGEYRVVAAFVPRPATLEELLELAPGLVGPEADLAGGWVLQRTLRIEE